MKSKEYPVVLKKRALRSLDKTKIDKQLNYIINRALGGQRGKQGWDVIGAKPTFDIQKNNDEYIYTVNLRFKRESDRKFKSEVADEQFQRVLEIIKDAGNTPGWFIADQEGTSKAPEKTIGTVSYADININPGNYFDHIYERDNQIKIVLSALEAARDSNLQNRFHTVLFGDPACAKTEILLSVKRMLGPNAVLQFDATSTSKAGAERILLDSEQLPPVLILEEAEKTDENSLRWLLGILDHRAEIRKTNFNIGTVRKEVKLLCLATVNDMNLFNKVMSGALASRFTHKVHCPRPSREVLAHILKREVVKVAGGKMEWIEPTLKYCYDTEHITDPRHIIAVCLCGKDALLDGSYVKSLEATKVPQEKK